MAPLYVVHKLFLSFLSPSSDLNVHFTDFKVKFPERYALCISLYGLSNFFLYRFCFSFY